METRQIPLHEDPPSTIGFLLPCQQGRNVSAYEINEFTTIGRDAGNLIQLEDPFISGRHARIERRANGFVLRDQNSRNGTFLNGLRITEALLVPNDKVRFGEAVFVFSKTADLTAPVTSKNAAWNEELRRLPAFAATDFPVLITGPSGSGKDVLALAVHEASPRKHGPFVSINCSALSESLIESELFGHLKGSFTGATHDRKGAFEAARGGTLFLDEIGDLPLSLQPKLLRALENREIRPVGADRVIATDARIIVATHKNLLHQVSTGQFREDLFYRLNVCQLRPPSLNQRMEDFEDLLYLFARQYRVRFSFDAIQKLKEHSWPGQIRELKNTVARAAAYMPGEHIQPAQIDQLLDSSRIMVTTAKAYAAAPDPNGSLIKEIEREMILQRLIANRGNQRRTAADLGLPKSTLHDRIRMYSIDVDALVKSFTV
ncbi:MAG: sigma 54-dependent Fis family transcriptional regulator [Bdellovibrionaceae bacterium]|nr:sigma 54-dependent Fis family transcriptional regulator [Pseudobdellovibrionaceae bacterium]